MIKQITAAELLERFENTDGVLASLRTYPTATGIVRYENMDLSSRHVGTIHLLVVGPNNTMRTLEMVMERRTYPYQPPVGHSWQYCPVGWCPADEVKTHLKWEERF